MSDRYDWDTTLSDRIDWEDKCCHECYEPIAVKNWSRGTCDFCFYGYEEAMKMQAFEKDKQEVVGFKVYERLTQDSESFIPSLYEKEWERIYHSLNEAQNQALLILSMDESMAPEDVIIITIYKDKATKTIDIPTYVLEADFPSDGREGIIKEEDPAKYD